MPKGRPRQFNSDKALDAALLIFWRRGYEGASLDALANAMHINMPSLYAAFGNKQKLFLKALDRYLQHPASYFTTALQQPTAKRVAAKLFAGAINMVMNPRHPNGCLLVHGALATSPANAVIRQQLALRRAAAQSALRRRLQLAQKSRDLPKSANPAHLARYLTTVLWGLSVQSAGGATKRELRQVAALALKTLPS